MSQSWKRKMRQSIHMADLRGIEFDYLAKSVNRMYYKKSLNWEGYIRYANDNNIAVTR